LSNGYELNKIVFQSRHLNKNVSIELVIFMFSSTDQKLTYNDQDTERDIVLATEDTESTSALVSNIIISLPFEIQSRNLRLKEDLRN